MTTEHSHPEAPEQIVPKSLNDYLEVMTKAVFQSGLSWQVVTSKWPGFQGFDVAAVATLGEPEIDALASDTAIVRNRRKIAATVHNAQRLIELDEEFGGIRNYLRSHGDFYAALKDVRKQFKYMGDTGTYYWLYVLGEEVPDYSEFCNRGK